MHTSKAVYKAEFIGLGNAVDEIRTRVRAAS